MKGKLIIFLSVILIGTSILYAWQGDIWGSITRETIISNAANMIDSTWTPLNNITDNDGRGAQNFYSGTTYTGELYAVSTLQNWTEFYNAVSNTSGGNTTYGNNCAGFVNVSWQLPAFYSLPSIDSNLGNGYFYALGELGDGQFLALLPGDAFYTPGSHIFLFSQYNADGTIESMEQVPPGARRRTWSWNALQGFRPIRRSLVSNGLAINGRVQTSFDAVVRSCPSFSCDPIWTAPIAAQGTIVAGPTVAEKYQWWEVQYDDYGTAGWTTEGYLNKLSDQTLSCTSSDTTPPTGGITINSGGYTNSRAVALNLSCTDSGDGCAWMHFSVDNSTWTAWEQFSGLKNWVLPGGDGPKNVYVQFADACGNTSVSFGGAITLQTPTPDLVVSSLTAPSAGAGGATVNITDTTRNSGSGGATATSTTFFLSTNGILDGSDLLLGSRYVPPLDPGTNSTGTTAVTIPAGTAPGSFVIIARANSVTALDDCNFITPCGSVIEASRSNNARTVKINIGPDLTISSLKAPISGSTISVTDTTQNVGGDTANSSQTNFYLSPNATLDSGDTLLGSRSVPTLAAGAGSTGTTSAAVPAGIPGGTYYVIAQANASNSLTESVVTNNTKYVTIKLLPDLVISALSTPATASAGSAINVTDTTTNIGSITAAATTTGYYFSTGTTLNSGATLLGNRSVSSLAAGQGTSGSASVTIPSGTSPGTYYIFAVADDGSAITEANYKNNSKFKAVKVQ